MDISKDNLYLLYKEKDNEDYSTAINYIDLKNLRKINVFIVDHDVEWISEGIKVDERS